MGYSALFAYALLESGVDFDSPEMDQLMDRLGSLPDKRVYSFSLYVLALDAWVRAVSEYVSRQKAAKESGHRDRFQDTTGDPQKQLASAELRRTASASVNHADPGALRLAAAVRPRRSTARRMSDP